MIYLDNGATSFYKPPEVRAAVLSAMERCANPGRGGYKAAMTAAETVYRCRESAAELFDCQPEQAIFTSNCTHGLNIAIRSLVQPGDKVVPSASAIWCCLCRSWRSSTAAWAISAAPSPPSSSTPWLSLSIRATSSGTSTA
ncbi:MAG: aminotransferase class V-fold PLP-dependent enzyme [Selenomonadaceae bacterium]|nr:aminotransferase class V-fold PLP-dependent enzyme [Selenomonadaceae bacterium]